MKRAGIYVLMLIIASAGVFGLINLGASLPAPGGAAIDTLPQATSAAVQSTSGVASLFNGLKANVEHPLSRLFIQLLVIILAARLLGKCVPAHGPACGGGRNDGGYSARAVLAGNVGAGHVCVCVSL